MRLALAVLLAATSGLSGCSAESGTNDGEDGGGGKGGGGNAGSGNGGSGNGGNAGGGSGGDGNAGGSSGSGSGFCGERTAALVGGSGVPENPATPLSEMPIPESSCNAVEREFAPESGVHVEDCEEIDYTTNPPCTGMHYGIGGVRWADYRVYDEAIPRGFWVHSLEHGAVAFLYSCTNCADEIQAATDVLDDAGADPFCATTGSPTRLTLLTPDPRLETAWAAASWGFTLTADCFEPDVFRAFLDAHRNHAPEMVCGPGIDPSAPP